MLKSIGDFINHKDITKYIKSNKFFNKEFSKQSSIPIIDYAFIHNHIIILCK